MTKNGLITSREIPSGIHFSQGSTFLPGKKLPGVLYILESKHWGVTFSLEISTWEYLFMGVLFYCDTGFSSDTTLDFLIIQTFVIYAQCVYSASAFFLFTRIQMSWGCSSIFYHAVADLITLRVTTFITIFNLNPNTMSKPRRSFNEH